MRRENKMDTKTGYKIVKKYGKNYCSVVSQLRRVYKVGTVVHLRKSCGPLAMFDSLREAQAFAYIQKLYDDNHYIVQCKYKESIDYYLYYPIRLLGAQAATENQYIGEKYQYIGEKYMSGWSCPQGTRFADWIFFNEQPTILSRETK